MTAKLVDYLQGFCTIGGNALIIVLDIMSLEMGKDFQVAFVDALTRSSAAVLIASHDALERMLTHDPAVPDNVLIEWLTALYLERKKRLYVMPIFVGQHAEVTGDSDSLGGKFFELFPVETVSVFKSMSKYTARSFAAAAAIASKSSSGSGNKCTMVQMLPDDITADATVRKAVLDWLRFLSVQSLPKLLLATGNLHRTDLVSRICFSRQVMISRKFLLARSWGHLL